MFFGMSTADLLVIGVIGVLLFGPDKLPEFIRNVTGFLRKVREFSDSAKEDVRNELGPEFKDFEFEDLHPKNFVRKRLLQGDDLGLGELRDALDLRREVDFREEPGAAERGARDFGAAPTRVDLRKGDGADAPPGDRPPFDADAT
ncbi:sec-independent protein translocase protein TatB [Streptomyces albospinus]|uniref:Sec-independent protein translocase protein TatB n=1 Tax=Streptomyces albospinus TaxID=285515 RepID=A0ABQ2VPA3_9ACTN|nr:sec-independent translocase [Streptomyces albospinus]GGU99274.1 sec-independent protein translocase protein TatB [Streptomyces albospinus]